MAKAKTLNATNMNVMNAVLAETGNFGERIPQATVENWQAVGNEITSYQPAFESFTNTLIGKIVRTLIFNASTSNKLARFQSGNIDVGLDIEEIWVDFAKAAVFDSAKSEEEYAKRVKPKLNVIYHRMNTQLMYKRTVSYAELKSAFTTEGGLSSLANKIIEGCMKGAIHDQYLLTKRLFKQYDGKFHQVKVDSITDEASALDFYEQVLTDISSLSYVEGSGKFRYAENLDQVGSDRLILFMHKDISPLMKTKVLSKLYNKDQLNLPSEIIELDDFGGLEDTVALLIDERWFRIYTNLSMSTSWFNPEGLYTNVWYHIWNTYSQSPYFAAIQYTTGELQTTEAREAIIKLNNEADLTTEALVKDLKLSGEESSLKDLSKADIELLAKEGAKEMEVKSK